MGAGESKTRAERHFTVPSAQLQRIGTESSVTPPRGQGIPPNNASHAVEDSRTVPFPKPQLCFFTAAELLPLEGVITLEFYSFTVSLNAGI